MAFIPPGYSTLRVNTLNLDTKFSTKLGRYNIVESKPSSEKPLSSLEVLIIRTQQVIVSKTDRATARDVFNQLVNELREILKGDNEEQKNRGAKFLLGALLHRYFRLIQEYDDYNNGCARFTLFFRPWDVRSSRFFLAIRSALKLPEDKSDNFRQKDLVILDVQTIVTSLKVFQENMLSAGDDKIPRYKKYPHFEQDAHFTEYLKKIIADHEKIGLPVLTQFKAVQFIQSLAIKVETERLQIEEELIKWSKLLEKENGDFSKLDLEKIEAHITINIKSEPLKEKILDLLYTGYMKTNLATMNHTTFLAAMKKCQTDIATYTVCGGYALLLQSKGIKQLQFCIYQALGIQEKPEDFTDKDMLTGIKFLKQFVENNPDTVLDYEFFGGKEKMNTQISQNEEALILSTKEKSEELIAGGVLIPAL